jgi:hypothetical protein
MAIVYNTSVVRTGLVLHLDAANPKSYPGTGNTWFDVSGNNSNGLLANGATISSGNLNLDGVDDVVTITSWPNTSSTTGFYTVEMLARWRQGSGDMFMGFASYDIYTAGGGTLGFNTASSDIYGISAARVTELGLVGTLNSNWKHYVFVFSTQVQNNEIWIDASQETLSQVVGTTNLTSTRSFSTQVNIGSWPNGLQYVPFLDCATFRIYNRKLTSAEILTNFEAARGRYGV